MEWVPVGKPVGTFKDPLAAGKPVGTHDPQVIDPRIRVTRGKKSSRIQV